ncbi:MAG: bis(5'-nucleosyl)-tetraphosphatase (symmetrical) YqeK [Phascolarctobacterium sp.]|nr:bis(5'-nucleosyl)-tetraphosphatase (symmetrical) YqeK [Phascolarctobacterium sp.]
MNFEEMRIKLQSELKPSRYAHSFRVYETAMEMAKWYGMPTEKLAVAALLHDCGRKIEVQNSVHQALVWNLGVDDVERQQPILLHQKLGAYLAKQEYGIDDEEILNAIATHTTGDKGMSMMAQVVYLADMIEPGRVYDGMEELREVAKKDLQLGMINCYAHTMNYLLRQGLLIHPKCVEGYNELLFQGDK